MAKDKKIDPESYPSDDDWKLLLAWLNDARGDDPDSFPSHLISHEQKYVLLKKLLKYCQQPELDLKRITLNYVRKLGNAAWGEITQIQEDRDWAEAEHQAKLIEQRLAEIEGDKSLNAKREQAFLKFYARGLLHAYGDFGLQMPGLPQALINIFYYEYPGKEALLRMLAFEGSKSANKEVATGAVEGHPTITQGSLARFAEVTERTIRNWTKDLEAAGWRGPMPQKCSVTDKSEEPVEPKSLKRGTPSLPNVKFMEGEGPEND